MFLFSILHIILTLFSAIEFRKNQLSASLSPSSSSSSASSTTGVLRKQGLLLTHNLDLISNFKYHNPIFIEYFRMRSKLIYGFQNNFYTHTKKLYMIFFLYFHSFHILSLVMSKSLFICIHYLHLFLLLSLSYSYSSFSLDTLFNSILFSTYYPTFLSFLLSFLSHFLP